MARRARLLPTLAALALAACPGKDGGRPTSFEDPTPPVAEACPDAARVGRVQAGDACPLPAVSDAQGGTWRPLGEGGVDDFRLFPDVPGQPRPDPGQVFCGYYWDSPTGAPAAVDDLPADGERPPEAWLDRDCWAVSVLAPADDAEALVWPTLRAAFLAQADALDPMPSWPGVPTAVAVVDSALRTAAVPPTQPGFGQHEHGRAVGLVIRDLACPGDVTSDPACHAAIQNQLAIDLELQGGRVQVERQEGGYFGFQGRVARTLVEAVRDWRAVPAATRLVINLSLGWDGTWNTKKTGEVRASVEAVRVALQYAACQGALVFAAAGNQTGGPAPPQGPMYPAAWEAEPAPAACATPDVYSPLVHAVGGVDGEDRPLRNGRDAARPRLVAPAFQVVAEDPAGAGPPGPSGFLTGTSAAAAVASAAAAAAWKADPTLTAPEVAQRLYDAAVPLGAPADFCLGGPAGCPERRRLSVCQAFVAAGEAACAALPAPAPAHCAALAAVACAAPAAGAGQSVSLDPTERAALAALATTTSLDGGTLTATAAPAGCDATVHTQPPPSLPEPCPDVEHAGGALAPWEVATLPSVEPCPTCSLAVDALGAASLDLAISARLTEPLDDAQLVLTVAGSRTTTRYDIGRLLGPLQPGQTYRVEDLLVDPVFDYASMSFTAPGTSGRTQSVTSELIVNRL